MEIRVCLLLPRRTLQLQKYVVTAYIDTLFFVIIVIRLCQTALKKNFIKITF